MEKLLSVASAVVMVLVASAFSTSVITAIIALMDLALGYYAANGFFSFWKIMFPVTAVVFLLSVWSSSVFIRK